MQGLYGALWFDKWKTGDRDENGADLGVLNAMEVWGQELAGFADQGDRIRQALEACRGRSMPPNLPEFLKMCRMTHLEAPKAIAAPRLTDEQIKERQEQINTVIKPMLEGNKNWALKLKERYLAKEHLPHISIEFASEVLNETWKDWQCNQITA